MVELSFREIENIIDDKLPKSATTHRAFWSNSPDGHVHAKAWLEAGYESEDVDLAAQRIVFRRGESPPPETLTPAERQQLGEQRLRKLMGCMKGTVFIPENVDIMEPVELEWDAD